MKKTANMYGNTKLELMPIIANFVRLWKYRFSYLQLQNKP